MKLASGKYKVKLKYSATSDESGLWDMVFQGAPNLINSGKLPLKKRGVLSESITVSKEDARKALEIRIWYTGKETLKVEEMIIKKAETYPVVLVIGEGLSAGLVIVLLVIGGCMHKGGKPTRGD